MLEGSVRKAGNRVRVTAQLIEARSDVHMWSETYERELDDVFAIQDDIAREVVTVLQIQLLGEVPLVAETDPEAYSLYLEGKHLFFNAEREDTRAAVDALRRALAIDPDYAPAWAALGRVQRARANWGEIDLREGTEEGRQAVLRALELDDTLADAWAGLARIQWVYDWDWDRAAGTVKTALMHGPNDAQALWTAATIAMTQGHLDAALDYGQRALQVDPLDPFVLRSVALIHLQRDEFALSQQVFEKLRELYPDREGSHINVAYLLVMQGRPEEALAVAAADSSELMRNLVGAMALHELKRYEEADRSLQYVIDHAADWLAYQVAEIYAQRGEADAAFEWLETAVALRDGGITYLIVDQLLDSLHADPRWEALLLKVGLLDAWRALQATGQGDAS